MERDLERKEESEVERKEEVSECGGEVVGEVGVVAEDGGVPGPVEGGGLRGPEGGQGGPARVGRDQQVLVPWGAGGGGGDIFYANNCTQKTT